MFGGNNLPYNSDIEHESDFIHIFRVYGEQQLVVFALLAGGAKGIGAGAGAKAGDCG